MSIEALREIYYSIRQNKVRTALSGFGVSWGILILVVLPAGYGKGDPGCGNGYVKMQDFNATTSGRIHNSTYYQVGSRVKVHNGR
jgi:hypothetical protein